MDYRQKRAKKHLPSEQSTNLPGQHLRPPHNLASSYYLANFIFY